MEKKIKILSFNQFMNEQETVQGATGSTTTDTSKPDRPETDREAKSRIAFDIIKGIFGDVEGVTGGVDSMIEQTKEVKESLPYRGCGTNEPYKLEKTPLSVLTIKILLNYLQKEGKGDYNKSIKELAEKRAVILGVRSRLDVKKETANQDRFCDALYYIPANASDGTGSSSATGPTGSTGATGAKTADKGKKNESYLFDIIDQKINELEYISESGVWTFQQFEDLKIKRDNILESRELLENGEITEDEFIEINEDFLGVGKILQGLGGDKTGKKYAPTGPTGPAGSTGGTGSTGTVNMGDMVNPYQITTVASLAYYGKKPMNPKGVGIKLPGDTAYVLQEATLGGKQKYKMMVESQKIKVGRYPIGVIKYETYKPAEEYEESCGMHIHRSSTNGVGICIGPWSAGCQVFADNNEWNDFISKATNESMNSGKFIYALIQLDDIPKEVLESALIGVEYTGPKEVVQATGSTGSTGSTASTDTKKSTKQDYAGKLKNFGRLKDQKGED